MTRQRRRISVSWSGWAGAAVSILAAYASMRSCDSAQKDARRARALSFAPRLKLVSLTLDDSALVIPGFSVRMGDTTREVNGPTRNFANLVFANVGSGVGSLFGCLWTLDSSPAEVLRRELGSCATRGHNDGRIAFVDLHLPGERLTLFTGDTGSYHVPIDLPEGAMPTEDHKLHCLLLYESLDGDLCATYSWCQLMASGDTFRVGVARRNGYNVVLMPGRRLHATPWSDYWLYDTKQGNYLKKWLSTQEPAVRK